MDSSSIQAQIASYETKITSLTGARTLLEAEIADAASVIAKAGYLQDVYMEAIEERLGKCNRIADVSESAVLAALYSNGMREDLGGIIVCAKIDAIDEAIDDAKRKRIEKEEKLEGVMGQLQLAQAELFLLA